MALVGSSVVVGKLLVARLPVFLIGGIRFTIAAVLLVPLALLAARGVPTLSARDLGVLTLQSVSGMFAFNVLLLAGLALTSAAEGGIVTSTTPAVAAAMAALALGERWTGRRSIAIGLAVLGILIVTALGAATPARGPQPALGNALVFGAVVAEAVFLVCSRVLARRLHPVTVAAGITLLGCLMFAPFALRDARAVDFTQLRVSDWLALVYYGVAVTVLAFVLWARGVRHVDASTAAVFTGVLPVSAVVLSYVVLGEPAHWSHITGGGCVLSAILLAARDRRS